MSRFGLFSALVAVLFLAAAPFTSAAPAGDMIETLPGYGKTKSAQYSGLIPVDDAKTAFLHYWFVSAINADPKTAPLTIWLNGGPGCSSLDGFMYENGPFTFMGDYDQSTGIPRLMDNPNSWATVSNMLWIESPVGVGYSYATNGSLVSNDDTTSQNLLGFLVNFYAAFPEFAKNELFITGESYAGFYVPQFSYRVYEYNQKGGTIPLTGFAVGNACVGEGGSCGRDKANKISINLFHGHGMISQPLYEEIIAACGPNIDSNSTQCTTLVRHAEQMKGDTDVYNVYDTCDDEIIAPRPPQPLRAPSPYLEQFAVGDPINCAQLNSQLGDDFLNHPVVKAALHVDKVPAAANWTVCASVRYTRNTVTLIDRYPTLIAGLRVLVYNGDADACVPWNGSEEWTRELGYKEKNPWHPWMTSGDKREWVAGFATTYDTPKGFAFTTIKHAGHMVPQYEPEAALTMFKSFITGSAPLYGGAVAAKAE